ncbi:sporulation related protein [Defluviimonas denitrificans]|uniref:Sporulation related protein n=1 Tax=Albidovulum denitrificans TaxID=404881 RepID=A0A2S8SES3_9RHOB|nr:SPOR domain-containing protein [Defluviimonas denitrificans]PQV59324.1 sporulation related protein [Defluviimonas denitrificans]
MRVFAGVAVAAVMAVLAGGVVVAQGNQGPRELPPADFGGNQYVDSAGCVFLRAGLGGQTSWVPRLGRDRTPVCGYEPSVTAAAAAPVAADPAPDPVAAPVEAAPAPAAAPATVKPARAKPVRKTARKAKRAPDSTTTALVRQSTVAKANTYCADRIDTAQRYLLSDGRRVTQCDDSATGAAVPYLNGLGVPGLTVTDRAPTAAEIRRAETANQGGYRVTYAKGNLTEAGRAAMATEPAGATGGAFVQIGAFGDPANAERAIATLNGLGLPVSVGVGGRLKVILAGPFASAAEVRDAVTLLRRNGYPDAYPTRG